MGFLRAVVMFCIVSQVVVVFVGIMYRLDDNERKDKGDAAEVQGHFEESKECVCIQTSGCKNLLIRDPPQGCYPSKHRVRERWKLAVVHMLLARRVEPRPPSSQEAESEKRADADC